MLPSEGTIQKTQGDEIDEESLGKDEHLRREVDADDSPFAEWHSVDHKKKNKELKPYDDMCTPPSSMRESPARDDITPSSTNMSTMHNFSSFPKANFQGGIDPLDRTQRSLRKSPRKLSTQRSSNASPQKLSGQQTSRLTPIAFNSN
ncbi:hypothetical protein NECAME_17575, partial [Necator americanus]